MYGYIYCTTNLVNGKIYIGQKRSAKFLENSYLGSGKLIRQAIEKYGVNNFSVKLLEEVQYKDDMDSREIYWISYYNATNRNIGYNISEGGNVNRTMVGPNNPMYGKTHSDKTKQHLKDVWKHRTGRKHTDQEKENISKALKGRKITWIDKISENAKINPNYGMKNKRVSDETKTKLSTKRKQYFSDKANKQKHSEMTKKCWDDAEYRKKHCEAMKGKKHNITYKECPICNRMICSFNLQRHINAHK